MNKSMTKNLFKKEGKYGNYFEKSFESCRDDAGKFIHDATKISESKFNAIKKLSKEFRLKNALTSGGLFIAICGGTCCLFEFLLSRRKNK